ETDVSRPKRTHVRRGGEGAAPSSRRSAASGSPVQIHHPKPAPYLHSLPANPPPPTIPRPVGRHRASDPMDTGADPPRHRRLRKASDVRTTAAAYPPRNGSLRIDTSLPLPTISTRNYSRLNSVRHLNSFCSHHPP
uniref:Uncharacterized protein n=1 Tax=Aegilops tauschii subsp. strangulata TaxID=200361 RepID=A0A453KCI9_AEGTS